MRHVFRRQLGTAAILATLAVTILVGGASAAFTTGSSGAAVCTGPTDPAGGCTFSGSGSATFQGQFVSPVPTVDPTLCPPQAADGTDTICGHFAIKTTVNGGTSASITFNPDNDIDLCVYVTDPVTNPPNQPFVCSTGTGATETVTFFATAGVQYELRILLISTGFDNPPSLASPAIYTGSVTFTAGAGGGGANNPPPTGTGHKVSGGGSIPNANFSAIVIEEPGPTYKGKLRFAQAGCDLRSNSIDSVTWNDGTQEAKVRGRGTVNKTTSNVDFVMTLDDNGEPSSLDFLQMDSQCAGAGNLSSGNIQYHVPKAA